MRLAATTGYGGFGLNEYNALRTYGMAPRPHLEGTGLTIGNIVADYPLGADGTPVPVEAEEPLPEGTVENYLASRERKLRLSDAMFQALEETADGQFRVLIDPAVLPGLGGGQVPLHIPQDAVAHTTVGLRQPPLLQQFLALRPVKKLHGPVDQFEALLPYPPAADAVHPAGHAVFLQIFLVFPWSSP